MLRHSPSALTSSTRPLTGTITEPAIDGMAIGVWEITTTASMPGGSGSVAGSGSCSFSAREESSPEAP